MQSTTNKLSKSDKNAVKNLEQFSNGLLWFCFTSFSDWLKKPLLLLQPIRCKTKTNHDLLACVFPWLKLIAYNCSISDWFICFCSVVIGWGNYFQLVLV